MYGNKTVILSISVNENDFIVLFKVCNILLTKTSIDVIRTYWNPQLNRLSHQSLWSNYTAIDGQILLTAYSCKFGDIHVFSCSGIKLMERLSVRSNLAVTTFITINYFKENVFQLFYTSV